MISIIIASMQTVIARLRHSKNIRVEDANKIKKVVKSIRISFLLRL